MSALSTSELLILNLLLDHGEMYELDMIEKSEGQLKRSSIYGTLARMQEWGWVAARTSDEPVRKGQLKRSLYRCTEKGGWMFGQQQPHLGPVAGSDLNQVAERVFRSGKAQLVPTAFGTMLVVPAEALIGGSVVVEPSTEPGYDRYLDSAGTTRVVYER